MNRLALYAGTNMQLLLMQDLAKALNRPTVILCAESVNTEDVSSAMILYVDFCCNYEMLLRVLEPVGFIYDILSERYIGDVISIVDMLSIPYIGLDITNADTVKEKSVREINRYFSLDSLVQLSCAKMHLGCGRFVKQGWLNIDLSEFRTDVFNMDAGCKFPFADNSFRLIHSEHMAEHMAYERLKIMVHECYRVLMSSGKIRIAMPDFKFFMDLYANPYSDVNMQYMEWFATTFFKNEYLSEISRESLPLFVINHFFRAWGHEFIHSPEEFMLLLREVGFIDVEIKNIGCSDVVEFVNAEMHMYEIPEWANRLETFVIEATKPQNQ